MSQAAKRLEKIVKYGLPLLFLALSFSSGAGTSFGTRVYLYFGITFFTLIWLLVLNEKGSFAFKKTSIGLLLALFLAVATLSAIKSVNVHASLDNLFLLSSFLLFYLLVINNIKSLSEILTFVVALIISGALLASYGIYQHLLGSANFISPNHLAGFLVMLFPLSFVLLINLKAWWLRILTGSATVFMLAAFYLTQSRGGFIAFLFVIVALALLIPKRKRLQALLNFAVIATEVALVLLLISGFKAPSTKIAAHPVTPPSVASASLEGRLLLWEGSMKIIQDYPYLGTGIGAFGSIYPLYQVDGLYSSHARNAFIESFAETGILGGGLFLALFLIILRRQWQTLKKTRDESLKGLVLAFFAGSAGFFVRNLGDFDWSIPVETLAFLALVGLTISVEKLATSPSVGADARLPSASGGSDGGQVPARPEEEEIIREKTWFRQLFPIPVFLGGGVIIFIIFAAYQGFMFSETGNLFLNPMHPDYDKAVNSLEKAVRFDPLAANYRIQLANAYFSKGRLLRDKSLLNKAVFHTKKATELEPYWPYHHIQLGVISWQAGQTKLAEEELKKAGELYPNNPQPFLILGRLYHSQKKYHLAIPEYRRAVSLRKHYTAGYPQDELRIIAEAHFRLGLLYEEKNQFKLARQEYKEALKINPNHPEIKKALQKL